MSKIALNPQINEDMNNYSPPTKAPSEEGLKAMMADDEQKREPTWTISLSDWEKKFGKPTKALQRNASGLRSVSAPSRDTALTKFKPLLGKEVFEKNENADAFLKGLITKAP